jgi:RecA/RadA recombinase
VGDDEDSQTSTGSSPLHQSQSSPKGGGACRRIVHRLHTSQSRSNGNPYIGFLKGKYFLLVGDSSSGKTFTSMTCFAEATRSHVFKDYNLIYDNIEDGMLMDVETLFGKEVAKRLRPPAGTVDDPQFSETVEDFYYHLDDHAKKNKPFIYILDSMDSLTSQDEQKKFDEQKKAARAGKDVAGSYGDGKAKKNSANLRKILSCLRSTGSILIVISQTRDNLTGWGETKTRSGGKALRFYATAEIWTAPAGAIKKTVRGKERKIGQYIAIQTKKNRITGRLAEIQTAIYPSYGIDDLGSCIDFLVTEKWWSKNKHSGKIVAPTITDDEGAGRDKLIRMCEEKEHHKTLIRSVKECWKQIDDDSALKRIPRYAK